MTKITRDELLTLRALECLAEWGPWIVETDKEKMGNNWLLAGFGTDDDGAVSYDVFMTTDGLHASECRGNGAKADADLCAALRNSARELIDAAEWALENGYGDQLMLPVVKAKKCGWCEEIHE